MYANWEYRAEMVDAEGIDEDTMAILYDPQTSGGLLIVVEPDKAEALVSELKGLGVKDAAIIGRITEGQPSRLKVL
jgi:selenide,water dikinase